MRTPYCGYYLETNMPGVSELTRDDEDEDKSKTKNVCWLCKGSCQLWRFLLGQHVFGWVPCPQCALEDKKESS